MDLSILQEIANRIFEIAPSADTGYLMGFGSVLPNVFRGIGIGPDKVKEPAPVDYVGAAEKTSQGNLELARQTAADNLRLAQENIKANRINQYTPYGSLEYTYGKKFDQAGYDKALAQYEQQRQEANHFNQRLQSGELQKVSGGKFGGNRYRDQQGNDVSRPIVGVEPNRANFESGEPVWSQRMNLTPEAQATLDKQMAMDRQYADIAQTGLTKAQKTLENPELDFSTLPQLQGIDLSALPKDDARLDFSTLPQLQGIDLSALPQAPIEAGKTAQQAIMSRLQPQLQQQENELAQRLANQGITLGSEAYQREMNLAGQRRNDLELQAAAQGISLDQAARMNALNEQNMRYGNQADMRGRLFQEQLAGIGLDRDRRTAALNEQNLRYGNQADMRGRLLQEQAMQKDRPLNLINALRSGAQVQNPTFQPYAQQNAVMQAQTAGPDYTKAGMLGYQQGMDSYNAQQARQQGAIGGLMGLVGTVAGLPVAGGGTLGGNYLKGLFGG